MKDVGRHSSLRLLSRFVALSAYIRIVVVDNSNGRSMSALSGDDEAWLPTGFVLDDPRLASIFREMP